MRKYPLVSIVFPNFNGGREPIDCLASIYRLSYPKFEVIVIDNNSTDGSFEKIRKKFPKVKLIKNNENLGFAKAVNQGIKLSKGEYVFIGNDDIVFEKNSLKILIDSFLKDKSIGIMGGKIFSKKNKKKIISSGHMMNLWTGNIKPLKTDETQGEPFWIQGCAMLIPKLVLNKVGFLDPGFNHFFEDIDLCMRVRKIGLKVVYIPNAIFWHGDSISSNKNLPQKYYFWYKNKFRFILKNLHVYNILSIVLIQVFVITPYRSLVLRDGRLFPFLKGAGWNLLHLIETLNLRKND